jgi:ATP-binding cassette subfamily B protein
MTDSFPARLARVIRRLAPEIRRHRRYLLVGTLGSLVVVACRLAYAWPLRGVLDMATHRHHHFVDGLVPSTGNPILWLSGAFLLIAATQGVGEYFQRVWFARFSIALSRDVRARALGVLARDGAPTDEARGAAISSVVGDTTRLKSGAKSVLIRYTQNGVFFVGVFVALLIIDTPLGLIFLAGGVALVVAGSVGAARVHRIATRLRKKEGKLVTRLHVAMTGAPAALSSLVDDGRGETAVEAKTARAQQQAVLAVHVILGATICAVIALAVHDARAGTIRVPDLVLVLYFLVQVHNPILKLGRSTMRLGGSLASAERVLDFAGRSPASRGQLQLDLWPAPPGPAARPVRRPEPATVARRAPDGLFAAWREG